MEQRFNYIYARESTKAQAKDGYNLVEQERKCKAYIEMESWNEPVKVLCEYGKSSKTMNRPELKRLIEDIKQGKVKRLIIYKLDRIVRRLTGLHEILKLIEEYKVEFVSVKEKIDTSSAMGRLMINLIVTFAEWEQDTISERTIEGLIGGATVGNYIKGGKAPFGYERAKSRKIVEVKGVPKEVKKTYLKVNEEEFPIVKLMFQYAMLGYSVLKITALVNDIEYMKRNNKVLTEKVVRGVLSNMLYCGVMVFKGISYEIDIKQAVSMEEFQLVKKMLHMRAKVNKNEYLYKGKILCTCGMLCSHEVTNKKTKDNHIEYYLYYRCEKCNKRINEKKISYYVLPTLLQEYKLYKKNFEVEKMKCKITGLNELKESLYNMYKDNEINKDTYVTGLIECEKDLKKVNEEYEHYMKGFEEYFNQIPYKQRAKLVLKYVDKIVVDMDMKVPIKILDRKVC